jgi:Leucine-rich repeat (LRR) protein
MSDIIIINGIKYNINITRLDLTNHMLTELPKEIGNLIHLTELNLGMNHLKELPEEIGSLTKLTKLNLSNNKLTKLPKEIASLTQLTQLMLGVNQLIELPLEITNLVQLTTLDIAYNKLRILPLEITNLVNLQKFYYTNNMVENLLNPIIQRFIQRFNKLNHHTIYNDSQNIHNSSIQQSIKTSILNLMKQYDASYQLTYLENDILNEETKTALIEYSDCTEVHSILNINFEELLKAVFIEIDNFGTIEKINILKIMNQEIKDSICKCFTGKLSRVINCLSGFSDKVSIQISNNEEISNIIITLQNKITDIDKLKKAIVDEMTERGYKVDTINEWILYIDEINI